MGRGPRRHSSLTFATAAALRRSDAKWLLADDAGGDEEAEVLRETPAAQDRIGSASGNAFEWDVCEEKAKFRGHETHVESQKSPYNDDTFGGSRKTGARVGHCAGRRSR